MSEDEKDCEPKDELVAGPVLPDGARPFVRHMGGHTVAFGVMKTARDGQPVNGSELVQLTRIEGERYAVQSLYNGTSESPDPGPSKVVSDRYRDGWDRIFGAKTIGQA